jgi:hypothetical protein
VKEGGDRRVVVAEETGNGEGTGRREGGEGTLGRGAGPGLEAGVNRDLVLVPTTRGRNGVQARHRQVAPSKRRLRPYADASSYNICISRAGAKSGIPATTTRNIGAAEGNAISIEIKRGAMIAKNGKMIATGLEVGIEIEIANGIIDHPLHPLLR